MNAKERCKLRRKLRRAAERAEATRDIRLSKSVAMALVGSERVAKALSLIEYKACPRPVRESAEGGAMCLPEVAMFNAKFRKSKGNVTAR
ncbi:hypothetical protein [Serratia bockelmannii]|uniref:hypothetical protein n=1 Tax=Serratia bockelmannii TaxID=2703793 RepID=UPI003FA68F7F